MPKPVRAALVLLFCVVQAVFGPVFVDAPLWNIYHTKTVAAALLKEVLLSSVTAFGIGYLVHHHWRWKSAKWLWLVGLGWLAIGSVLSAGQSSVFDSTAATVWRSIPGTSCVSDPTGTSCTNFFVFTVLSNRAIFYSLGAICCAAAARTRSREQEAHDSVSELTEEPRTAPPAAG